MNTLKRLGAVAAIALLAASAAPANAALLTYFNFNDVLMPPFPDVGSDPPGLQFSVISGDFFPGTGMTAVPGTTLNAVGTDPAGFGFGLASGVFGGSFVQFSFSMLGFQDLSLSYATLMTAGG